MKISMHQNRCLNPLLFLFLLLIIGLTLGCSDPLADQTSPYETLGSDGDDDDAEQPSDDDSDADDDDDDDDDDDSVSGDYNVEEIENFGADWDCADDYACACTQPYYDFMDLASDHSDPITWEELEDQMEEIEQGRVNQVTDPFSKDELGQIILDQLNNRFLLEGINERLLRVTTIRIEETADSVERELLFEDPLVGVFKAILLLPKEIEGPVPGVLAVHGHSDCSQYFRDVYCGSQYPQKGLAVLMITNRAMCADQYEGQLTPALLQQGFTFMGLRIYEIALAIKYLKYLPEVDAKRIGYIGHSGGSSFGNVAVRLDLGIQAFISDAIVQFYDPDKGYRDETVPGLYPYRDLINDLSTCSIPTKTVEYGDMCNEGNFQFFKKHL